MRIKITMDSTSDLPPVLIEQHDISLTRLCVVKNGIPLIDGIEIIPDDIFDCVDGGGGVCHTVAVNVADYDAEFSKQLATHDAIIHFSISSDMSSCYQNAVIAAEKFENVYVIDSGSLSSGIGYSVVEAAIMAQSGSAPGDIVEYVKSTLEKVETSFVIDSLKYLHKGGRCSSLATLGANVLKLKPCIEVKGGKMDVGKKYRGNFDKVILQYVSDKLRGRDDIDTSRIFVTFPSRTPRPVVDEVVALVKSLHTFDAVYETVAGCSISNHCGPVCLGVIFKRK